MKHTAKILSAALVLAGGLMAAPAAYAESPDGSGWVVRGRILGVIPDEGGTTTVGGKPEIDNSVVPELDISYFIDRDWALELILATTPHDGELENSALGASTDLGDVWLLPPTLLLQRHFTLDSGIKPYIGAGLNYTFFYNADAPGGTVTSIEYDDGFGFALQVGVDYPLDNGWFLNADVKKLFLSTDVSVNGGAVTGEVDIDPWIVGVGVGYRF